MCLRGSQKEMSTTLCLDVALECKGDKLRLALNGGKTQNTDIIFAISLMVTDTDNKAHCLNENSGLRNKPKRMTCLQRLSNLS